MPEPSSPLSLTLTQCTGAEEISQKGCTWEDCRYRDCLWPQSGRTRPRERSIAACNFDYPTGRCLFEMSSAKDTRKEAAINLLS
jgi:hypothetical protein